SSLDLPDDERARAYGEGGPIEYSHTMTEQIGGQLAAGFALTHLVEAPHHADATARYMPGYFATRALKPGSPRGRRASLPAPGQPGSAEAVITRPAPHGRRPAPPPGRPPRTGTRAPAAGAVGAAGPAGATPAPAATPARKNPGSGPGTAPRTGRAWPGRFR